MGKVRKIVRVTEHDVFNNCHIFKDHKDYVAHRFIKEHGCKVIDHSKLTFWRGDSDKYLVVEYHGIVGESLQQVE